jgi:hypothetical protein
VVNLCLKLPDSPLHSLCSQVDEAPVWSELGHAYLAAGQVPDAIASYIRSNDTSKYAEVIDACKGECSQIGCILLCAGSCIYACSSCVFCLQPAYPYAAVLWVCARLGATRAIAGNKRLLAQNGTLHTRWCNKHLPERVHSQIGHNQMAMGAGNATCIDLARTACNSAEHVTDSWSPPLSLPSCIAAHLAAETYEERFVNCSPCGRQCPLPIGCPGC